jgi:hypothetical protein
MNNDVIITKLFFVQDNLPEICLGHIIEGNHKDGKPYFQAVPNLDVKSENFTSKTLLNWPELLDLQELFTEMVEDIEHYRLQYNITVDEYLSNRFYRTNLRWSNL